VEVSYADHITNKEVSIRDVASFSGIHVLYEQTCPRNVQFCPPETIISVNFKSNSMEMSPQKSVKVNISSGLCCLLLNLGFKFNSIFLLLFRW
jgi:hypothetical protein